MSSVIQYNSNAEYALNVLNNAECVGSTLHSLHSTEYIIDIIRKFLMPLFDFKCECGHTDIDVLVSSEAAQQYICEKCGKVMSRVIAPAYVVFGSSFHKGMGVQKCIIKHTDEDGKTREMDMSKYFGLNGVSKKD